MVVRYGGGVKRCLGWVLVSFVMEVRVRDVIVVGCVDGGQAIFFSDRAGGFGGGICWIDALGECGRVLRGYEEILWRGRWDL